MKRITLIFFSLTLCLLLQAQIPQAPTNLQSPNAARLGLNGEIPVSLFTGIPEISIPLFTAPNKYNGFSIGLSYHAGGVHPDQHSGWVGTNWSLMAGGCITRVVKGFCDELLTNVQAGYYYNAPYLSTANMSCTTCNNQQCTNNTDSLKFYHYDTFDTEPDEFSFNFGEYSGKFYFDRHRQIVVKCNKPVKIIWNNQSLTVPDELKKGKPTSWIFFFSGFSIITENGDKYEFGGNTSTMEYSMEFWNQLYNQWNANAWYLRRITYMNGKTIDFNYERGDLINQMYFSYYSSTESVSGIQNQFDHTLETVANFIVGLFVPDPNISINGQTNCSSSTSSFGVKDNHYEGELISPIYLKSIVTNDFSLEFSTSITNELKCSDALYNFRTQQVINMYWPNNNNGNGISNVGTGILPYIGVIPRSSNYGADINAGLNWRKLDVVTIYDNNKNTINSYAITYNNNSNERLFLNTIAGQDGKKYNFEYNDKEKLPPYLADKNDHWGFFNNNTPLIFGHNYYSYKESDPTVIKYGSLKSITYPTGGKSEFAFEANQYSSQVKLNRWEGIDLSGTNKIAGGLRVVSIKNYSPGGIFLSSKEYYYNKNLSFSNTTGVSSGVLGGRAQYLFENYNVNVDCSGIKALTVFSTQSVLPLSSNSMGSHIGYTEVIEKLNDGSYTRYKFSNFDNGYLDEKYDLSLQDNYSQYQPYNSKEQERGNLLSKEIYNTSGNIQQTEVNSYVKNNSNYLPCLYGKRTSVCPSVYGISYVSEATQYRVYTYSMLLDSKTTTYYDNSQQPTLTQVQSFKYNLNNQVTNETLLTSDGKEMINKFYYPIDIKNGKTPSIQVKDFSSLCNALVLNNCISPLIAQEQFLSTKFINGIYNDYTLSANNYPLLSRVYLSNSDQTYRKVYECSRFDSKNNPIEISEKEAMNSVFLWGYNSLYPIAEIKNATYSQVSTGLGTSPESLSVSTSPDMSKVDGLRTNSNLAGSLITSYTYKPLVGITSKTDPRAVTTHYLYDSFGRLGLIKDNNLNITGQYRYAYQNVPETSITSGTNVPVSGNIIKNDNTNFNTNTSATLSITGGSGNLGYNWYLKNDAGNVLQSAMNSGSTQFNFKSAVAGALTLQCDVIDYLTNSTVSITKQITCSYLPMVVGVHSSASTISIGLSFGASVSVTGGSGNYSCVWYFDLASSPRGGNSFGPFVCNNVGVFNLKCVVTDITTNLQASDTVKITVVN